jgi:hypothetical protein
MKNAELMERCEDLASATATQPRNLWPYWVRQLLTVLEAEAGENYEATLAEIRAELDARLILGEW